MRSNRYSAPFILAIAVLAHAVSACQPLPQPFRPDASKKIANPLIALGDKSSVVVRPVEGMPADSGTVMAREMAAALVDHNLLAFAEDGNSSSLVLTGQVIATSRDRTHSQIRIIWRLLERNGTKRAEHALDIAALKTAWTGTSPSLLRRIAQKSAEKIAKFVQNSSERDQTADRVKRRLYVGKIVGAPETAGALLRSELETALRRQALRVSSKVRKGSVVIVGTVNLAPGAKGLRQLSLEWVLMSADSGDLGKLRQKNSVTPDALENQWPKIAGGIALGAAQGIGDLLRKIPESALRAPPTEHPQLSR